MFPFILRHQSTILYDFITENPPKSALEPPQDPLYKDMFYLNPAFPNRAVSQQEDRDGRPQIRHMNISGAWEQGYSGKGITRSEIDD